MSIRSAFKSKFKNSFDRDGAKEPLVPQHSKETVDEEPFDGVSGEFKECFDDDSLSSQLNGQHHVGGPDEGAVEGPGPRKTFSEEKAVYELQLTQLQEQLVAAMIESQNLATEVKALKEKPEVDRLKVQLEHERERNRILSTQLKEGRAKPSTHSESDDDEVFSSGSRPLLKKRLKLRERSASASDFSDIDKDEYVELKKEDLVPIKPPEKVPVEPCQPPSRVYEWMVSTLYDFISDFTEVSSDDEPMAEPEGDPLTVKQLKDNMKRFYSAGRPVMSTLKSVRRVLSWETPSMTILVLIVYVNSVWQGWLFPVTLLFIILRLLINWLKSKGLITNFHYLPREEEKEESDEKDSGVSDRFNLVLQVARKVQNGLGYLADSMEKIHNLLMWRHPAATLHLLIFLLILMVASCLLSGRVLFQIIGLYMALKLFVIDYVYDRFPRVRLRHDTTWRLWRELPTNAEVKQRTTRAQLHEYILPPNPLEEAEEATEESVSSDVLSSDDRTFLQLFSLPNSENPMPDWTGGRRCTLINREKSLTSAFKNGKLFLTRSFLCFERTKSPSPKNLIIPLADITRIDKAKPYSWMPGGGMSLEVHVTGVAKPLMFGALLNRDEIFESIMAVGMKAGLSWAPGATPYPPTEGSTSSQSTPSSPTQPARPMVEKLKVGIQYIEDSD